ncbi:MAG: hypothetical protein U0531_22660 [Dehalococcoidia bacterium]
MAASVAVVNSEVVVRRAVEGAPALVQDAQRADCRRPVDEPPLGQLRTSLATGTRFGDSDLTMTHYGQYVIRLS